MKFVIVFIKMLFYNFSTSQGKIRFFSWDVQRLIILEESMNTQTKHKLDKDWVILMKEAKNLGLDIEDVKKFLSSQSKQKDAGKQLKQ